jgi:hypothetical protein
MPDEVAKPDEPLKGAVPEATYKLRKQPLGELFQSN